MSWEVSERPYDYQAPCPTSHQKISAPLCHSGPPHLGCVHIACCVHVFDIFLLFQKIFECNFPSPITTVHPRPICLPSLSCIGQSTAPTNQVPVVAVGGCTQAPHMHVLVGICGNVRQFIPLA